MKFFVDRHDAGRSLARSLERYAGRDAVVLAVPAAGPIAAAVAAGLGLRLEPDLGADCDLRGRIAIVVGDGLRADHDMAGAVAAVRARGARRVVVAVPVGAAAAVEALEDVAHDVVCPFQPQRVGDVAGWYDLAA